jgi:hypothetical protein
MFANTRAFSGFAVDDLEAGNILAVLQERQGTRARV